MEKVNWNTCKSVSSVVGKDKVHWKWSTEKHIAGLLQVGPAISKNARHHGNKNYPFDCMV